MHNDFLSHPKALTRRFHQKAVVGTPRCGVPAPCRRGPGASPSDGLAALTRNVPPLNAAATAQRAIPTFVSSLPAETLMRYPGKRQRKPKLQSPS